MTLYLSKIRIARSPSANALATLLSPREEGARVAAHHQLLWAAFADGPDRARDFLWRENGDGTFMTLSARPPQQMDLFMPHETKPLAPVLSTGDRLGFLLRANATRTKRDEGKQRGARVDVVMDALYTLSQAKRAGARMEIAQREGAAWLERQGETAGFRLLDATVEDYSTQVLSGYRGPRKGQPQFGVLEMSGRLEVLEPETFITQLAKGFGRAKAFGYGLMLVRRG